MDSSEDDFSAVMLISLSKIASRWMLLIPTQIELLALFQSEERSFQMQATSLRCHRFILGREVCSFPSTAGTVNKLFGMLHRPELQPILQLEALRILYKILLFNLSSMPCVEIPELFQQLFIVVKNMLQSSIVSSRILAVGVLEDLSGKVLGRKDVVSGGNGCAVAFQVISFVLDQILLLVTTKVDIHQADFGAEVDVKSLLNTLFNLVKKHSDLHCLMLNNICLFIDKLMNMLNKVMDADKTGLSNREMAELGSNGKALVESKILLCLSKITVACLQNLEGTDAEINQVLDALKLQAENVCHCSYFGSYTSVTYFLILHLHSTFICMRHVTEDLMSLSGKHSLSCVDSILQLDKSTLDCAKKMLGRNSYWYSYKAGKTAACQGAWSTAAFIFEHLRLVVQSGSCSGWLKSLAQFSTSEKQIQLFLDQGTSTVPAESDSGEMGVNVLKINHCRYMENLLGACHTLLSAEETLAASDMGDKFSFQRWFLTLRAKTLKAVVDMLKLLHTNSPIQDKTGSSRQLVRGSLLSCTTSQRLGPFIDSFMEVSCRMKKLAQEYDLFLTSFMGMDRQSMMSVSALALSCSIMAFTAGFAFLFPSLHSSEEYRVSKSGNSEEPFPVLLIEDLAGRLGHIDSKTRENLQFLLKSFRNCNSFFSSRFKIQISCSSYEAIVFHKLCEYSVGQIFSLRNEATRVQSDVDASYQILDAGSQLLMNIISKLTLIPFCTPHYFFRVRSAVSSELLIMNEDGQTVDGSSILSGLPLSLNLSFQLKNMPAGLPGPLKKVYCVLNCKPQSPITSKNGDCEWQAQLSRQDEEISDIMDLNEKLLRYVIGSVDTRGQHCRSQDHNRLMVTEYVCFELNERGQGFSTCFLDISSLLVGSYQIKWHSISIDSGGSHWSLLPVTAGPIFTVHDLTTV